MAQVKVGTPYPAPAITAARFGKYDMVIPYTIDGVGPFEVRVPQEDFTPSKGEAAVKEQARGQTALKDKEFTV